MSSTERNHTVLYGDLSKEFAPVYDPLKKKGSYRTCPDGEVLTKEMLYDFYTKIMVPERKGKRLTQKTPILLDEEEFRIYNQLKAWNENERRLRMEWNDAIDRGEDPREVVKQEDWRGDCNESALVQARDAFQSAE